MTFWTMRTLSEDVTDQKNAENTQKHWAFELSKRCLATFWQHMELHRITKELLIFYNQAALFIPYLMLIQIPISLISESGTAL